MRRDLQAICHAPSRDCLKASRHFQESGIQFDEGGAPTEIIEDSEGISLKQQKATIVLVASVEARLTSEPVTVQTFVLSDCEG